LAPEFANGFAVFIEQNFYMVEGCANGKFLFINLLLNADSLKKRCRLANNLAKVQKKELRKKS